MLEFISVPDFLCAHQDDIFVIVQKDTSDDADEIYAKVLECIALGNGNYLLGVQRKENHDGGNIEYYALSDIRLSLYEPRKE